MHTHVQAGVTRAVSRPPLVERRRGPSQWLTQSWSSLVPSVHVACSYRKGTDRVAKGLLDRDEPSGGGGRWGRRKRDCTTLSCTNVSRARLRGWGGGGVQVDGSPGACKYVLRCLEAVSCFNCYLLIFTSSSRVVLYLEACRDPTVTWLLFSFAELHLLIFPNLTAISVCPSSLYTVYII